MEKTNLPELLDRIEIRVSLLSYWFSIMAALLVGWLLGSCGDILGGYIWDVLYPAC